MPELPEVETVKNELLPVVSGKTIKDNLFLWERTARFPELEEFRDRITGQCIVTITRRGKYLIFHLSGGEYLVVHLKMTGSLLFFDVPADPDPWVRALITFTDGTCLHFRDPRKFGGMWLVDNPKKVINRMGPEPLGDAFTLAFMKKLTENRTTAIKAVLLDQTKIAGIGNMYADEALFEAGIHPRRMAKSLTDNDLKKLHSAIRLVLSRAIERKGASVTNYCRPDGSTGTAHLEFKVAHRRGEQCPSCGTPLERIIVGNRGTYFCPNCQSES